MKKLSILILAAGKGVRMKSKTPKVLHPVGGRPILERVLKTVQALRPSSVAMVVGHQSDVVKAAAKALCPPIRFYEQINLDGSGGAVRRAVRWLQKQTGDVIVTCGDTPLLMAQTLKQLRLGHQRQKNAATVLSADVSHPYGYGRIVRAEDDSVEKIVEQLDATPQEKIITEINTGTYCFSSRVLIKALPKLKNKNVKREYYLTDVLELIQREGGRVGAVMTEDEAEALGVNRRSDLAEAEKLLRWRILSAHMEAGVTLLDPDSTYIDEEVKIEPDTVIHPQSFIKGKTRIGSGCQIGPWAHIQDCVIKNNVIFKASFAESSEIGGDTHVGPYSRVRPGSRLGRFVHLGNFSEVKKTVLGEGSKVNHLSYLGDAIIGKNVNIGAGSITCNYDGVQKYPTFIEDQSFIGSNVNLIAPVRVGAHAVVGAGSSLSQNVPPWALAVERSTVVIKPGWAKKKFRHLIKKKG